VSRLPLRVVLVSEFYLIVMVKLNCVLFVADIEGKDRGEG